MGSEATINSGSLAVGDVLEHYGVRGMKWGIRRRSTGSSSSSPAKSSKDEPSEDHMKARVALSKPAAALSNNEMQALITRMNLEQQYTRALATAKPAPKPSKTAKVGKFVTDLLLDVGRTEVRRLAKTAGAVQVERAVLGPKAKTTFRDDVGTKLRPPPKKKGKG